MQLGVVEGFYGKPWTWEARLEYSDFLKSINFDFYIYAPKADQYLREKWYEPLPSITSKNLRTLSSIYHEKGLAWGIGISLFNAYVSFDDSTKLQIKKKIEELLTLSPDIIAVLFDDMRGNIENIAEIQTDIVNFIQTLVKTTKILFCPTYYSFDPLLDKFFGERPKNYLKFIGANLDSEIDIIWTGPLVRSESFTVSHLKEITKILGRKIFIWDNFIANDGKKHEQFLYVKSMKNRILHIDEYLSGYMINPMNQPYLSQISILTIISRQESSEKSMRAAIEKICSKEHTDKILYYREYLLKGRHTIPENKRNEIINYLQPIHEKWSVEILNWLQE